MSGVGDANLRNIAFCGHGSAGKTTLVDSLLVSSGAVTGAPSVDDGTSVCDFDPEEHDHKYSIEAAVTHCDHAGKTFNLIDTPGYPDFIGQAIGAIHAVETVAVCVNAHTGIQINTRRVFQEAGRAGVGRIIVLTKTDDQQADFRSLIDSLRELWGTAVVPFNVPLGHGDSLSGVASTFDLPESATDAAVNLAAANEQLVEAIVEVDEAAMEKYLEGDLPDRDELAALLPTAIAKGSLIPVFTTAAKKGIGVTELLDGLALCAVAPSALDRTALNNGATSTVRSDPDGPLVAQVFKTRVDPFVQKLSFLRLFSGRLSKDQTVHASAIRKGVKMGQLMLVQGNETENVDEAVAGQIVAVAKMDDLHTGTSVGDLHVQSMPFPRPMVGLAVTPKKRGDETKLLSSLQKIVEEDPTFKLDRDPQTGELVVYGMSDLHLQVVRQRLARRDKVEIETHDPKIPFRETIQAKAEGSYRHKKQSGGRGQFGEVHIRMYPLPKDTDIEEFATKVRFPQLKSYHYDQEHNFLWVDSIVGGSIPGNFLPAVEKGFKERMSRGVIAGHQVQDIAVEVHYGKHHAVDSSEAAFKTAGSMAFKKVFLEAKPCLLEPVVTMDITIPEVNVGDIYSDMSSRGGKVLGSASAGGTLQSIHCEVPLRSIGHYNRTLSSVTGGQGSYSMDYSHYDVMPANVQHEIMAGADLKEEEEDDG